MKIGMCSIKEIYNLFQDDLSKEIYLNKLNFEVTGNYDYINRIVNLVSSNKDHLFSKQDAESLISFIRSSCKKQVAIYGAGMIGKILMGILKKSDVKFFCFCDKNVDIQDSVIDGISVISPEKLLNNKPEDTIILFAVWGFYQEDLIKYFKSGGYQAQDFINGFDYLHPRTLYANNMYFQPEIISFDEEEIFIDGGSFDFSTSLELLKHCKTVKKIIALEPDEKNILLCEDAIKNTHFQNISLVKAGLWSEMGTIGFHFLGGLGSKIAKKCENKISITTIDETLKGEKVTFIKLDVEGAELEALMGAKQIIKDCAPKLAVSIYHKPDDLITIPYYLKSLVPKYNFYLRHYSNMPVDTVLYAVVK